MDTKLSRKLNVPVRFDRAPCSLLPAPCRAAFTLVELLVVITIIGILASLIVVAAVGALKKAQETRIKVGLNQISDAIEEYKNKHTAYPPNCQTDGTGSDAPLDELQIFNDLKRHLKQVAQKHRESDDLLKCLAGIKPSNTSNYPRELPGGMTAGEAIVFWLGGFSSDPKYPISGEGGPSYSILGFDKSDSRTLDPISNRRWVFPFEVTRLGPRANDEYFDDSSTAGQRYIEYTVTIPGQNNNQPQFRRINFWQYTPAKSTQPFLYFDTSRHPAAVLVGSEVRGSFDPPAATKPSGLGPSGQGMHVHALKKRSDSAGATVPIQWVDPEKFQLLHCGIDDAWGEEAFERMSAHGVSEIPLPADQVDSYLLFPTGPFTGDVADTIVNFITQTKLEDAQP